jgi:hypothetical protein
MGGGVTYQHLQLLAGGSYGGWRATPPVDARLASFLLSAIATLTDRCGTCTKPFEKDVDIAIQRRYFLEVRSQLLRKLLSLRTGNLPIRQIVLIA